MKVSVDVAGALKKFLEALAADDDLGNQADGGPDRIAAPDPIPHGEAMIGSDTELVHGLRIGRNGDEVIAGGLLAERTDNPRSCRVGVGLRLLRDESLGTDNNQGLRRVERARQILELGAVDVGHEVRRDIAAPLRAAAHRIPTSGPKSEPPMPMFTTCLNFLPVTPTFWPLRTAAT